MNWTSSYRQITTDIAAKRGMTYEEVHEHVSTRNLFLIDKRLWWKRVTGR